MYKTLYGIFLTFFSFSIFANTLCPLPVEIHCHNSYCSVGAALKGNWQVTSVAGAPSNIHFILAEFAFAPAPVTCVYGSSEGGGSAVALMSDVYYTPDVTMPNSQWQNNRTVWRCGTGYTPINIDNCFLLRTS